MQGSHGMHAGAAAASAPSMRPFPTLQWMMGVEWTITMPAALMQPGPAWAATVALVAALFLVLWRSRRRRVDAYIAAAGRPGSATYEALLERTQRLITQIKEAGNKAYLERDYETAGRHFRQAVQETVAMCKLTHPQMTLLPVAHSTPKGEQTNKGQPNGVDVTDAAAAASDSYPPPGQLATQANPALSTLPLATANNLAIFYSNRSACLLALNRYPEALHEAECAVHCQPLWSKGYLRAGQAYEGLGLLERAESMYLLGAAKDPRDENVARCVANLRAIQREVDDTRREIERDELRARREQAKLALKSQGSDAPVVPVGSAPSDKFNRLTSWLTSHGASFPYLYLRQYSSEHRGVHTLCRIPTNKVLLSVPLRCIMTSDVARDSRVGRAIDRLDVELASNHSYMACFLLEERAKAGASFWEPYISVLPQRYDSMPIFFSEEEKRWLKGSFTLPKIVERHRELRMEWERLCVKLDTVDLSVDEPDEGEGEKGRVPGAVAVTGLRRRGVAPAAADGAASETAAPSIDAASNASLRGKFSERHSLSDFIWARSVVITRIFGFTMTVPAASSRTGTTVIKTDGLVPMADMLNHKRPRESSWNYDDSRGAFVITSLVPFAARAEVCDSYGRKCNSRFFINYGFCIEKNRDDNQAVVWVPLDCDDGNSGGGDEGSSPSEDPTRKQRLVETRKRLLSIRGTQVNERAAATQTLQQSASSLSSSSFVLSTTPPTAALSAVPVSASAVPAPSAASAAAYPPPDSLRFQLSAEYSEKVTRDIMCILRVVVASDEAKAAPVPLAVGATPELRRGGLAETTAIENLLAYSFLGDIEYGLRNIPPLSVRNEVAVLRALADAAQLALAQFDSTAAEDDALLAADDAARQAEEAQRDALEATGGSAEDESAAAAAATNSPTPSASGRLTFNQRNCVLMRRGEKQVLEHYVSLHAEVQQLLSRLEACRTGSTGLHLPGGRPVWQDFVTAFVQPRYGSGERPFDLYLTTVFVPLLREEEERSAQRNRDLQVL